MSVVCVDAGTSVIKAVAFDDSGNPGPAVRRELAVARSSAGRSELDMHEVGAVTEDVIRAAVMQLRHVPDAIALTGQGDGCWLVDAHGEPTGPAILWNDARAAAIVSHWDEAGILTDAFKLNGNQGFAGASAAILAWLSRHDPGRLEASASALSCGSYLFGRLTGERLIDASDAANPFLDIRTLRYEPTLLDLFGITSLVDLLPPVAVGRQCVSGLRPPAARRLALPVGLPVVMAPFDIPATALGIGTIEARQAFVILGTTLCTAAVLDEPVTDGAPLGMTVPLATGRTWIRAMAAMAGTEVVSWTMRMLGLATPGDLLRLAADSRPGAHGLLMHPYLSPAGERAPIRAPLASGSFVGLSLEHTPGDIARAVVEGLTFVIRECLAAASSDDVAELTVGGGGARSDDWCQLLSDVTGVAVSRPVEAELGARGALRFARSVLDLDLADRGQLPPTAFEPRNAAMSAYDQIFEQFVSTRTTQMTQWCALRSLREYGHHAGPETRTARTTRPR